MGDDQVDMGDDLWSLPMRAVGCTVEELQGFAVEAEDGPAGVVASGRVDAGRSYLIVSLDPAFEASKAMLPAGIVESIDARRAVVQIGCSRAHLADAPRFENDRLRDGAYRAELASHYAAGSARAAG